MQLTQAATGHSNCPQRIAPAKKKKHLNRRTCCLTCLQTQLKLLSVRWCKKVMPNERWGLNSMICAGSAAHHELATLMWQRQPCSGKTAADRPGAWHLLHRVSIPLVLRCPSAGATRSRKDTCQGDSGGPLLLKNKQSKPSKDVQVGMRLLLAAR